MHIKLKNKNMDLRLKKFYETDFRNIWGLSNQEKQLISNQLHEIMTGPINPSNIVSKNSEIFLLNDIDQSIKQNFKNYVRFIKPAGIKDLQRQELVIFDKLKNLSLNVKNFGESSTGRDSSYYMIQNIQHINSIYHLWITVSINESALSKLYETLTSNQFAMKRCQIYQVTIFVQSDEKPSLKAYDLFSRIFDFEFDPSMYMKLNQWQSGLNIIGLNQEKARFIF